MSYPDRECARYNDIVRRGFRENLQLYYALVFDPTQDTAAGMICALTPTNGIFFWSDETLRRLSNINFAGDASIRTKQLHATGYLIELYYDLLIAPCDNISKSPGFETCLGTFGNTE